jgi:hypothetical protein
VWTAYFPSRSTQFVVTHEPQRWRDLPSLYIARGWITDSEPAEAGSVIVQRLVREEQSAVLCYTTIDANGELLAAEAVGDQACLMVQSFSILVNGANDELEEELTTEFKSLLDVVRQDIKPKAKP